MSHLKDLVRLNTRCVLCITVQDMIMVKKDNGKRPAIVVQMRGTENYTCTFCPMQIAAVCVNVYTNVHA